jgi:hypothetical protein
MSAQTPRQFIDSHVAPRPRSRAFLLFSLPRSGSTTLCRLLNCHPNISCIEEPFNPFNYGGRYLRQVKHPGALACTVAELRSIYTGIKHTWTPDGWPFLNDSSLNQRLLLTSDHTVLFLRRRNVLKRLVSLHISRQTNVWGLITEEGRSKVRSFNFSPLSVAATKVHLAREVRDLANVRRLLIENEIGFRDVWYEDLYDPTATACPQLNVLNEIFSFLGKGSVIRDPALAAINRLFDRQTMKLNSVETYRRIPGIEELERHCGSDETGWLFRQQLARENDCR